MNGILCETIHLKFISNCKMMSNFKYLNHVESILIANNNEFIPNLYDRIEYDGTLESKVSFRIKEKLEDGYHYILALDKADKVVGFTEVKECESLIHNEALQSLSVGTSAIHKEFQGKGIAKLLYAFLDDLAVTLGVDVIVRNTWSTNARQLKLYDGFGYKEVERIPNFRGEGIDSMKFCKWFKRELVSS